LGNASIKCGDSEEQKVSSGVRRDDSHWQKKLVLTPDGRVSSRAYPFLNNTKGVKGVCEQGAERKGRLEKTA